MYHAGAVIDAGFADALDDAAAYIFLGAFLGFIGAQGGKGGLYLPKYARDFEKLFSDGGAVSVDGDAG